MEGLVLLLLLALGSGGKGSNGGGTGNGGTNGGGSGSGDGYKGGPAGVGPIPTGDPPGGCALHYPSPEETVAMLNMLGYTPMPEVWGPDAQLGTFDADPDAEVRQFQLDYNQASRSKWVGPNAGGLMPDGMMGECTMAAMAHAEVYRGSQAWRDRYMHKAVVGFAEG